MRFLHKKSFGIAPITYKYCTVKHDLYKNDNEIKRLWNLTPKISADFPHFLQNNNLLSIPTVSVKNHIKQKSLLYKLTYKFDIKKYSNKCILGYLYKTIVKNFGLMEYHLKKNY